MTTSSTIPDVSVPDAQSYKNLVDLMAIHSDATGRMANLETELQGEWLALVDAKRSEFAKLQQLLGESEEGIEQLATSNPQWFVKSKSLKTPYGTVQFRSTTKLIASSPDVTIALIKADGEEQKGLYLRQSEELNLEALEKLDDHQLARLHITRETSESCTVKPIKIDLGKAVKKAAAEAAKAAPADS